MINDRLLVATLAERAATYELAAHEYEKILGAWQHLPPGTPLSANDNALLFQTGVSYARILCSLERYSEAIVQFRLARQQPVREEVRRAALAEEVALLKRALGNHLPPETAKRLRAEINAVERQPPSLRF